MAKRRQWNWFRRNNNRQASRPHVQRSRRALCELLEDRRLLAAITWDGGGGNLLWSNAENWSNDQLPVPGGTNVDVVADGTNDRTDLPVLSSFTDSHTVAGGISEFSVGSESISAAIADPVIGSFDSSRAGLANIETGVFSSQSKASLLANYPGLTYALAPTLTPTFLSNIDILFIHPASTAGPITPLTSGEQSALFDYVAGGGSALLLLEGQSSFINSSQSMAAVFGLTIVDDGLTGPLAGTSIAPTHPIFTGPFGTQTSILLGGAGVFTNLGPYAQSVATMDALGQPIIAVIEAGAIAPGSGRVILTTDTAMFIDDSPEGSFSNHQTLHSNMVEWLHSSHHSNEPLTWDGGGGDLLWSNPLNWSTNELPGAGDDVTLDASGSVTVIYDVDTPTTIKGLTLSDSLTVSGSGPLTVTDSLSISGGKTLTLSSAGSTFLAEGATTIDGASLIVTAGTLSLPGLTTYTEIAGATFQSTGAGSVLDLPNLTMIAGGPTGSHFPIQATGGGRINLSQVTQITSPASPWNTGVDISAEGNQSLIDLSELAAFTDSNISTSDSRYYTGYSSLSASGGGSMRYGATVVASGVEISVDSTSLLIGTELHLGVNSTLSGQGEIIGSVVNIAGTVTAGKSPVGLTIDGNYTQLPSGTLSIAIDAAADSGNYSQLIVTGTAALDGTLAITRAGGFVPSLYDQYSVVSADSVTGSFSTVTGGTIAGGDLTPYFFSKVVALSRQFAFLGDLAPSDVQWLSAVSPGGTSLISWTVTNLGQTDITAPQTAKFYLSSDTSIGDDLPVGEITYTETIATGASVTRFGLITIPTTGPQSSGLARLVVEEDANNTIAEFDETNNAAISASTRTIPILLSLSPANASVDENIAGGTLTITVSRTGDLSQPLIINLASDDLTELTVPASVTIAANESSASFDATVLNDGLSDGDQIVRVTASGSGVTSSVANVTVKNADLPDLIVSSVSAPGQAFPNDSILSWQVENIGTAIAVGPWIERVYLSNDAAGSNRQLLASYTRLGNINAGATPLVRTETLSIPTYSLNGDVYFLVEVDAGNALLELDEQNLFASETTRNIPAVLGLAFSASSLNEGGSGVEVTLTRNGDVQNPLTVDLAASPSGRLILPASVTIPAGQYSQRISISAHDDAIYHEETSVLLTATAVGFPGIARPIQVIDNDLPTLSLSMPSTQLSEGNSVTVTVARDFVSTQNRVLTVVVDSDQQLTAPATVTLLAGQNTVQFTVTAVDDLLIEPNTFHTITVSAAGHFGDTKPLTILASDLPTLGLELPTALTEGAQGPSILGRVTRDPATSVAIDIELTPSDPTQMTIPATVRIPAGQSSVYFPIQVLDDSLFNGSREVNVTARVIPTAGGPALSAGAVTQPITILDNDGLTLAIHLDRASVAEGFSATATIARNSIDLSQPLTISLSTSPQGQLSVPTTVVIPAGAGSVTVNVQGIEDGLTDGDKIVTLLATAENHSTGSATIVVVDSDLPDLDVLAITPSKLTATTSELLDVSWTIGNVGYTPAFGTWTQRVSISNDAMIGNDVLAGQYSYTGPLVAGESYDRNVGVRMPSQPGSYWLVLQTDVANTVDELLESNNTRITSLPIIVSAGYSATASTTVETAPANSPVLITGTASNLDGTPAFFKEVSVHLSVRGTRRVLPAITDATGNYSLTFTPLPGEAGRYMIGAAHPGEANAPVQDEFLLVGMRAEPPAEALSIREAGPAVTGSFTIRNLSDVPLTELALDIVGIQDNIEVTAQFRDAVTGIGELGTVTIDYSITALDATNRSPNFQLRITTLEAPSITVPIDVSVIPLVSRLVADKPRLDASMLVGDQTSVEFTITNVGGIATGPLEVLLPTGADWLSLATPATMNSLDPGQSTSVTLLLTPPKNLELTAYNSSLIVRGGDSEILMPFTFRAVAETVGDLQVTVTDEYFYFTEEKPLVTNATVRLLDVFTGAEIASSIPATSRSSLGTLSDSGISVVVDAEGRVSFRGIPKGPYTLEVRSDQHETYSNTVRVESGELKTQQVFISRNLVEYTWTVEEVEIEDRTRITIEADFETNVPAPVVVVDGVIDLADLTVVGQSQQFDIRISNHGLIAANEVKFNLGSHPFYRITPLVRDIGVLPARSEIVVPVLVERIATFENLSNSELAAIAGISMYDAGRMDRQQLLYKATTSESVPCFILVEVESCYECGPEVICKTHRVPVINVDGNCPIGTVPPSSSGGGGGGGGVRARVTPVTIQTSNPCDCEEDTWAHDERAAVSLKDAIALLFTPFTVGLSQVLKDFEPFDLTFETTVKGKGGTCCFEDGSSDEWYEKEASGKLATEIAIGASLPNPLPFEYEGQFFKGDNYEVNIGIQASAFLGLKLTPASVEAAIKQSKECGGDAYMQGCLTGTGLGIFGGLDINVNLGVSGTGINEFLSEYGIPLNEPLVAKAKVGVESDGLVGQICLDNNFDISGGIGHSGFWVPNEPIYINFFGLKIGPIRPVPSEDNDKIYLRDREPVCFVGTCDFFAGALSSASADVDAVEVQEIVIPSLQNSQNGVFSGNIDENKKPGTEHYVDGAGCKIRNDGTQPSLQSQAAGVCAGVRMRVEQEAVMARSGFAATFDLVNNDEINAIEQIEIEVHVYDSDGNPANSRFGITDPVLSNLDSIDGIGTLNPNSTGRVRWIILPGEDAAPELPTDYFVGGFLRYEHLGVRHVIPFDPAAITVFPDASLALSYFLQRDVIGDDPHTPGVESSEPFTLAVMVRNDGAGAARNLRIESAQPRIVENEKGLLVDFEITGTRVNGQELNPTLTAQIGNVGPGELAIAEWEMESTLQGLFVEYNATFEHLSGLGDNRFSLIKDVQIRELIRSVDAAQVDGGDGLPDFLVNDLPDPEDLPDTLYLSDGSVADVSLGHSAVAGSAPTNGNLRINVMAEMDAGWSYLRMDDPSLGNFVLIAVERSDGSTLPLKNFWQTDRTFVGGGLRPVLEDRIHLLDYDSTGSYTFVFSNGDFVGPEVVAFSGVTPNPTAQTIDVVDIEFSEPLNLATLTPGDLSLTKNGIAVATTGLVIAPLGNNIYRISGLSAFTAADAVYELFLDMSQVTDQVGNPGSGVESYRWVRGESSPTILSLSGAPSGLTNQSVDFVDVVFSKPIVPTSFGLEDVSLRQDGNEILDGQVTIAQLGPSTYRIGNLARLIGTDGVYRLSVDAAGVQDTGGASGIGDSVASWTLDATAPLLVTLFAPPTNPRNIVVQQIDVEFSEPIDVATFDLGDLTLVRDGGTENLLASDPRVTIEDRGNNRYRIGGINWVQAFFANPQVAQFTLTVDASGIRDLAGSPATGTASSTWTIDLDRPEPPANLKLFTFAGEVVEGQLNSRFATVTGELAEPGLTIAVLDVTTNTELIRSLVSDTDFSLPIEFPSPGQHLLRVLATDAAGNTVDAFIENLFVDEVAPLIESIEGLPAGPTNQPLSDVLIRFVTAIDPATVTTSALTLRRNGGANLIGPTVTIIPQADGRSFVVSGLSTPTASEGIYELILDLGSVVSSSAITGSGQDTTRWTMDTGAPTSHVATLPESHTNSTFVLSVLGNDPDVGSSLAGSGIIGFDIFVSENDGPFTLVRSLPSDTTSTTFTGIPGSQYRFYSIARDAAGSVEMAPEQPDAVTTILNSQPASIGNRVWTDANGNGIQDDGELGKAGVAVRLFVAGQGTPIAEAVTNDQGLYSFNDLNSLNSYFLEFVAPAGFGFTVVNAVGSDNADSDADIVTGRTAEFSVLSGVNDKWDAGLIELSSLGGIAWQDSNGNRQLDAGERKLAGQIVYLDVNQNGAKDNGEPFATTDQQGAYTFTNLRPGYYMVRYVLPEGWEQTQPGSAGASQFSFTGSEVALTAPGFEVFPGLSANDQSGGQSSGSAQNTGRLDVTGDGRVSALDALQIINRLNGDSPELALRSATLFDPRDVNLDGRISAMDAMLVINALNTLPPHPALSPTKRGGEGTGVLAGTPSHPASAAQAGRLIGLDRLQADSQYSQIDGRGLAVVVIDTGVDVDHPFFGSDGGGDGVADRIVYQYDFADRDADADDVTGHGSHVTSIIASSNVNYPGVAPGVNIISLKVFSNSGSGTFADLERALQWVIANVDSYNIAAVNLSLGDGHNWSSSVGRYGVADELAVLDALGVITVAAAGNSFASFGSRQGLAYPAADPNVISVGAVWDTDRGTQSFGSFGTDYTTAPDRIAGFSQRDASYLDLLAPGALITGANATGGIVTMRGTSMAAPYVTGAAVLAQQVSLAEHGRRLSNGEMRDLLRVSGVIVRDGDDEHSSVTATGAAYSRLDVVSLLNAVTNLNVDADDPHTPVDEDPGQGGVIDTLNGSYAYQLNLEQGEVRMDIDFGSRPIDATPPSVTGTTVQNGLTQRSHVDRLVIEFSEQVNLGDLIDDGSITSAITLTNLGIDVNADADQQVALSPGQFQYEFDETTGVSRLTWSLDQFAGTNASLPDGLYEFVIDASFVTDLAGNSLDGGDDFVLSFHRLAGDVDGDLDVDPADLSIVNSALGSRPGGDKWNPDADLDRDNWISVRDRVIAARANGNRIIPPTDTSVAAAAKTAAPLSPFDTNFDGDVSASDALVIINHLGKMSRHGEQLSLDDQDQSFAALYDVNRDGHVSALDALQIINQLQRRTRSAEEVRSQQYFPDFAADDLRDDDDWLTLLADDWANAGHKTLV